MDKALRNTLRNVVTQCRRQLEQAIGDMLQGQYGIHASGEVENAARMTHLSTEDQVYRERVVTHLQHIKSSGLKPKDAVAQLVREAAFTHLNRLCAYKMMATRGLIADPVGKILKSRGFLFYLPDHPEDERLWSGGEQETAYKHYLEWLNGTLSEEIGVLFSPQDIASGLFPPHRILESVLELLNSAELQDIWKEDETIGWVYQYFTPKELRDQARKESAAPRNSYEMAFRNQFFTPRYVVEFLTDNTLGRLWYEMRSGDTALKDECLYLVRSSNEVFLAPNEKAPDDAANTEQIPQEELLKQPVYIQHRPKKDPRDIRILDPASGSGHFLLYCFALLLIIYQEAYEDTDLGDRLKRDYPEPEAFKQAIPGLILEHNLHGVDIDLRATQIAALALWMRAQRAYHEMGLKAYERPEITRTNIICAEPMPGEKELLDEFVAGLQPPLLGQLVRVVFDKMKLAGELGTLLKIEEEISEAIGEAKKLWRAIPKSDQLALFQKEKLPELDKQETLFDVSGITDEQFWQEAESRVVESLSEYARNVVNGKGLMRRLFADDATQGFALVDICRKKFDIALMNPPFGKCSDKVQEYFEQTYEEFKSDIGIAFVDRWCSALNSKGLVGAITSRTFLASDSLEDWRAEKLLNFNPLQTMLDLGYGVLDDAMVETAAYVLASEPNIRQRTSFLRLLEVKDKENVVTKYFVSGLCEEGLLRFDHSIGEFENVPLSVICYWLPRNLLEKILARPKLNTVGAARHGLVTTDDFRFLRAAWEVSSSALNPPNRWAFLAKGGEYQPYWDDIHLIVDWEDNGNSLKSFLAEKRLATQGSADWSPWLNHHEYYFQHGLTYPERTTSDFCPRILPEGVVFSSSGQAIQFDRDDVAVAYIGGAFSRVFRLVVESFVGSGDNSVSGSAAKHYRSGLLNILPTPLTQISLPGKSAVLRTIKNAFTRTNIDETTRYFLPPPIKAASFKDLAIQRLHERLERAIIDLECNEKVEAEVEKEIGVEEPDRKVIDELIGKHPLEYESDSNFDAEKLAYLWNLPSEELVLEGINLVGARRQITKKSYIADRRLELVSHILKVNPRALTKSLIDNSFISATDISNTVRITVSYMIGCVFGRWDLRYATSERLAPELAEPFAPLPVCAPGALTGEDGLPLSEAPEGYPLRVDSDGILVDDPTHADDLLARVREVFDLVWPKTAETREREACELLGVKELRDYFRKPAAGGFWTDHVKRYSKSRRKAPIYWMLRSSKGSYSIWLYYHRLDKDILFKALLNYVEPKIRLEESSLAQLRTQRTDAGDMGKAAKQIEKQLERQESLLSEIYDFRDKLQRAANLHLEPDLNDGVVLNIAPLHELVPWSEAKKYWEELLAGKYEWSSISKQLRERRIVKA